MASSNDVKSAKRLKTRLLKFMGDTDTATPAEFQKQYNRMLLDLQSDLCQMAPTPVVSLASQAIAERRGERAFHVE